MTWQSAGLGQVMWTGRLKSLIVSGDMRISNGSSEIALSRVGWRWLWPTTKWVCEWRIGWVYYGNHDGRAQIGRAKHPAAMMPTHHWWTGPLGTPRSLVPEAKHSKESRLITIWRTWIEVWQKLVCSDFYFPCSSKSGWVRHTRRCPSKDKTDKAPKSSLLIYVGCLAGEEVLWGSRERIGYPLAFLQIILSNKYIYIYLRMYSKCWNT